MEQRYNDFNIKVIKNANYPLIKIMKSSYEKKLKAQRDKEQNEECRLLALQNKGVNIVKEHILKRKREFLCHQRERTLLKQVKKKELEENILHKYNINLQNMETRNAIVHKLINYDKSEKMKMNTQKQRMKFIVQKLLTEIETKEKELSPQKQKIIKRKKPEQIDVIDDELDGVFDAGIEIEDWEDLDAKKVTTKTPESRRSRKSRFSRKIRSSKKSGQSQTSRKNKSEVDPNEYVMPHIPKLNQRYKYNSGDESKMVDLIPACKAMNIYLDDLKDFISEMQTYPIDPQFSSKPQWLQFMDFENGKIYKNKLNIYNYSTDTAICSFERIISDNEFCNVNLEVEDVGIQKIIPGKYYSIQITFRPKDMQHLDGKLVFLTRRIHDSELKRFEVQVTCEIATINLTIQPPVIIFKSIPVWKIKSRKSRDFFKTIEVYNGMIHDCKLVIRRKLDEPVLEEEMSKLTLCEVKSSTASIRRSIRKSKRSKENSLRFSKDEIDDAYRCIKNILDSCLEYVDYIFFLNTYFIKIPQKTSINLQVFCKELPHIGCFSESYEFEFISVSNNILLTENLSIEAEVTGKFIVPEQSYLDFNTCMYNFIYQESVKIFNHGTSRLKIGFLFPSKIKKYFSIYPATFFMKPASHETVHIRFMPRRDICQSKSKYFDKFNGILSFPVKICILAPRDSQVPPSLLTVYSIITDPDKLNIRFTDRSSTYFNADNIPILHLGAVTTHETVIADIEIENLSAIVQEFGFLNLPEAVAIDPNYGFGTINPSEIKCLKIYYSPTIYDMITIDKLHTYEPVEVSYKITCTTAYKIGEIKERQIPAKVKTPKHDLSINLSGDQMLTPYFEIETDNDLFEYHEYIFEQEELEQMYNNEGDVFDGDDHEIISKVDDEDLIDIETAKNLTIILKATIVDYWTEISHQNIIFPDTPLGSYSTMKFQFSATNKTSAFVECICGFIKKSKLPNFDCHFEIFGGVDGITVEPICGDLKKNEHKQIYLIAKPSPDASFVFTQAQILKTRKKSSIAGSRERTRSSKVSKINSDMDLYLAEKEVWKSIKPYSILGNYVIVVNFTGDSYKSNEVIYLTVSCKIIKPQFITSLRTQVVNFGYVPIGTRPKKIFKIQNVARHVIEPKIQLISPVGAFTCTTQHKLQLEKEFILKIPITFSPTNVEVYNEFFEIKSENTIETVMVSGEGVTPKFQVFPEYNVFRVLSKGTRFEDCIIYLENKCKAPISIKIIQTCELIGIIIPDPTKKLSKSNVEQPQKKDKKTDPTRKVPSARTPKIEKMSLELTPDEEYSLANCFQIYDGLSPFKIEDLKNNTKIIEPEAKSQIKIRFESPKIVEVNNEPVAEVSEKSNKKVKAKKEKMVTVHLPKEYKYVAKYNIMMGNIVLIKDFIIIGEFQ